MAMQVLLGEEIGYSVAQKELKRLMEPVRLIMDYTRVGIDFFEGRLEAVRLLEIIRKLRNKFESLENDGDKDDKLDILSFAEGSLNLLIKSINVLEDKEIEVIYHSLIEGVTEEELGYILFSSRHSRRTAQRRKQATWGELYKIINYHRFMDEAEVV